MYIVVSEWEVVPGHDSEFRQISSQMRAAMRATAGVHEVLSFEDESERKFAVVVYDDRAAYDRIVNDPNGPFAKAAAEKGIDQHARWVGSFRGDTLD